MGSPLSNGREGSGLLQRSCSEPQIISEPKRLWIELQLCPKIFAEFKEDTKPEECQFGSMVLLEHLRYNGFTEQSNRKAGFDMAHTKLVLEALADFHAVTYGYLKQKHGSLNDMVDKEPLFARDFIGADPPVELEAFKTQFAEQGITSQLTLLSSFKDDKYEKLFKLFMEKYGNPTTYGEKLGSYKNFAVPRLVPRGSLVQQYVISV
ncbi:uncharacterized protein LOC131883684 [Tigriopus californicus]|uniref:uncharacterized protein LOC131883684 n=1 Tax=Tigriopus californicus TaxID=6832 RepID=UPI0027DA2445|nr:uncharacterized protein LOC131883684 [Tigriopus californicus]